MGSNSRMPRSLEAPSTKGLSTKNVIDCYPPPTLHYMLQATNFILKECSDRSMKKYCKKDHVKAFTIKKSIVHKGYHGGEF